MASSEAGVNALKRYSSWLWFVFGFAGTVHVDEKFAIGFTLLLFVKYVYAT